MDDGVREESEVAEAAMSQAQGFYSLLSDMREDMILGALAGIYHQWEKDLRDFLERELLHYVDRRATLKGVWRPPMGEVFELLGEFGWDCAAEPFFPDVDACRVVVNVHKHGKGNSLTELAKKYPEFLAEQIATPLPDGAEDRLDHEWLRVTKPQFDRLAGALRAFWVSFPERSFAKVS